MDNIKLLMKPTAIAIVIPAHNEVQTISACLASVQIAIEQLPSLISASVLVVLDSCTDSTLAIVKTSGVDYISCEERCVGRTRDLGIRNAIATGATWLACTDADSIVSADWLKQQIIHIAQQPTDMICGVVSVDSWTHLTQQTREDYAAHYQDIMGHRHIHGANLSFSAEAYLAVGGFSPLACHEDVDLVKKFEAQNYAITWSNKVRVITSSRLQARASEGFANFLSNLEKRNSR
ncbi:MAG: glycosyltransferase [Psychrobacter urativorans]